MVEREINVTCKNSPRKECLKAFNSAFAKGDGDIPFIEANLHDDVVWNVGAMVSTGKSAMVEELEPMKAEPVKKLVLQSVVTHGRDAAASGEIHMASGEIHMASGEVYAFSDVNTFVGSLGTVLKSITSYVIKI